MGNTTQEMVRPKDLGLDQNDFLFMKEEPIKDIIDLGLSDMIKKTIVDSLDKDIHANMFFVMQT